MTETVPAAGSAAALPQMGRRARQLQVLSVALSLVAVVECLSIALLGTSGDPRFALDAGPVTIGFLGSVLLFSIVGTLIVQRRPYTRVAWLMIVLGLGLGLALSTAAYGLLGQPSGTLYPGRSYPFALEIYIASQLFFVPTMATVTTFILLLFPTDRFLGPRWRLVGWMAALGSILYEIGAMFRTGLLDPISLPGLLNPIAAPPALAPIVDGAGSLGNAFATAALVLAAASLVIRYRRADPVVAAQIRWVALVAVFAAVALVLGAAQSGPLSDLGFGLGLVFLACMPIAIGIAITRYRLYDIDRLINRALVYGSLTAILAGVFTAGVGLAQRLFVAATHETSDAAIVGATLVVATLYAPLRKRLEALIDRRFKFEEATFGAYRDELVRLLSATDPQRAAERLVREAVRELPATGGATLDARGAVTATAGLWPVEPLVRITIPGGEGPLRVLAIGPRPDGELHDPRSLAALEELASLAAAAATQARGSATPPRSAAPRR